MDQRDAARFAIAQTRHNLSVIAQELASRAVVDDAKHRAKQIAKERALGWIGHAVKAPAAVLALAAAGATLGWFAYNRFKHGRKRKG